MFERTIVALRFLRFIWPLALVGLATCVIAGPSTSAVEGTIWLCKHPDSTPTIVEFKKGGKLMVDNRREGDLFSILIEDATYAQEANVISMKIGVSSAKCTVNGNSMQCAGAKGLVMCGLGDTFELEKKK